MRAILTGPMAHRAPSCAATAVILDATLARERPDRRHGTAAMGVYLQIAGPDDTLAAVAALRPDGIVLSRCEGGRDVARLGARLAVIEAAAGLPDGATGILAMIENAGGVLGLRTLGGSSARLGAILWDAEAMALAIDAAPRDRGWRLIPPLSQVRSAVRIAAAQAGVPAVDTAFPEHAPRVAFLRDVEAAQRDGFAAKLATSAEQADLVASR